MFMCAARKDPQCGEVCAGFIEFECPQIPRYLPLSMAGELFFACQLITHGYALGTL